MPELPEVETVVRELNRKLKDKTVKSVSVLLGKIISLGPGTVSNLRKTSQKQVDQFVSEIKGQKIKSVKRRAKLLIFEFKGNHNSPKTLIRSDPDRSTLSREGEKGIRKGAFAPLILRGGEKKKARSRGGFFMLVHLKMTGQFIYFRKSELHKKIRIINKATAPLLSMPGKYTHVIFTFTDGSKLFYNDLRQFGYLKLVADHEFEHVRELKDFGPEPLEAAFSFQVFRKILGTRPNGKIKQVLLDPKLIAGIGNIYSDEILFKAKVKPERIVLRITKPESREIYKHIKEVLKKGIEEKGSSVGDFIRTDGKWGSMGKHHFVYGRKGLPCKICGNPLKSVKLGGRTGTYCFACQK